MAKYSDWRSDLREVMDDDTDNKKVTGKGCDNKKLIKINPKLGEAVEQIGGQILEVTEVDTVDGEEEDKSKKFEKEKQDKIEDKNKKKEMMLKKRIVRMKMMAVNQGAGDSLVAHHEPEGEMVESAVLDANKELSGPPKPKRSFGKKVRRAVLLNMIKRGKTKKEIKQVMHGEEVVTERLGGKGYKPYTSLTGKKISGDWEDSDRGAGNKAKKRAGGKVEKKSPTYRAYVLNKEDYETKKTGEVLAAFKRDPKVRKRFEKAAKKEEGPGSVKNRAADSMLQTAKDTAKRKGDTSKSDDRYAYEEVVHNEGVMKFIKDRVGGKKKPEKKASMDSTTDKLHTWRKSTSDKQKEHEKYVNFLPVDEAVKGQDTEMRKVKADERKAGTDPKNTEDPTGKNYAKGQRASVSWWKDKTKVQKEEVVTELNRYGKETGKATGSLNKRPGSPVATRNQPNSAVNIVRRNIIRPQTGRPEGQRKKVKGEKGRVQPGDRKFTPAQTISRMRAQVAAADAAMRDTRGT